MIQPLFDKQAGYSQHYLDWYEALVVDNHDPDGLERLKVRVLEFHGDGTGDNDTPDDILPWAAKMRMAFRGADVTEVSHAGDDAPQDTPEDPGPPTGYGGVGNVVPNDGWPTDSEHLFSKLPTVPDAGSVVPGLFGVPRIGSRVFVISRRNSLNSLVWFLEPCDGGSLVGIPNRDFTYGYVDENGNVAYVDVEDNSLNLVQFGSMYITVAGDNSDLNITVAKDANVHIYGNANITIDGNANIQVGGNASINIEGNETTTVGGNATLTVSGNLHATADGDITASTAGSATVNAADSVKVMTSGALETMSESTFMEAVGPFVIVGKPVHIIGSAAGGLGGLGGLI